MIFVATSYSVCKKLKVKKVVLDIVSCLTVIYIMEQRQQ